jgi:hypothetical protein
MRFILKDQVESSGCNQSSCIGKFDVDRVGRLEASIYSDSGFTNDGPL